MIPSGELSDGLGLYLHFPFCSHRCHYCDYAVEPSARPPVDAWLEALEGELEIRLGEEGSSGASERPEVRTIYLGGGTPSLLAGGAIERLGRLVERTFTVAEDVEWTVEANPEHVDRAAAERWRGAGVSRVNLGVQSFQGPALRWLGRLHDPAAARRALDALGEAGPGELGVDLLYGLPARVGRSWERELELIRELEIPHVTLYGLTAEPGTPLGRWTGEGSVSLASEERSASEYLRASRLLEADGWEHYQVTGLARPGRRCRHDLRTWAGEPTLGLGPSAHSWLPPRRSRNVAGWHEYRKSIARGALPVASQERLSGPERETERIWLRLHTRDGIRGPLARRLRQEAPELMDRLVEEGLLRGLEPEVAPTPEGWLRLDDLAEALASALGPPRAARGGEDRRTAST